MTVASGRRLIHKSERERVRESFRSIDIDDGVFPDRVDRASRSEIGAMVQDRRAADHLGSLLRWARHHANHDPGLIHATHEDRVQYFASVLPNNLAGRHALTHIDFALRPRRNLVYNRRESHQRHLAIIHTAVLTILAAGCHAELNQRIRRAADISTSNCDIPSHCRPRLLLGAHDAAAFADATVSYFHSRIALEFAKELTDH